MAGPTFEFDALLWRWDGPAAWMFVSLPEPVADEIADLASAQTRAGFGSVKVQVHLGDSTWSTSLFPDSTRGTYLLPVKKAVRIAQDIDEGARLHVAITVVQPG